MLRWLRCITFLVTAAMMVAFVALPGCNTGKKADADKAKDKDKEKDGKAHDHADTGPHGGPLVEWGDDVYHAEVTIDPAAKMAIVYVLDDKAAKAPDVEPARFSKVKMTIVSEKPNITIDLTHDAKKSGPEGIAFTGSHDFFAKSAAFKGNVSSQLDESTKKAKPFNGDFEFEPKKEKGEKKKSASIKDLFQTPGGIYTAADIKANGSLLPMEKYKGRAMKEEKLAVGDKLCPIGEKKADAGCFWIVQGQRYEFCCPPCINTFVKLAHNEPAKVKDAKEYVFKGS